MNSESETIATRIYNEYLAGLNRTDSYIQKTLLCHILSAVEAGMAAKKAECEAELAAMTKARDDAVEATRIACEQHNAQR